MLRLGVLQRNEGARRFYASLGFGEQTRIFRRFQETFRDYDLVLSPTTPVSPRPWTEPMP